MKTVKSIEIGKYKLSMHIEHGLYYVCINDKFVLSRATQNSAMFRFDMEYNTYCQNFQ